MTAKPHAAAMRIALTYAALGSVWIVSTDGLAHWAAGGPAWTWALNSLKDLVFIAVSGALLFEMMRRHLQRLERKQVELRVAAQFAQGTLDSLSSNVAILDISGVILAVNRAWRDFARRNASRPEAVCEGANYLEVIERAAGDDADYCRRMAAGVRAVLVGECAEFSLEYACQSPAQQRWFAARVTRFEGEGRGQLVIAHEDITQLKLTEAALKENEQNYRDLFEDDPQPMMIYETATLQFVHVNKAMVEHYGYTREELLGMTIRDIHPPEDVPALEKNVSTEKAKVQWSGIWRHRKKSGGIILADITSHRVEWEHRECRVVRAEDVTLRIENEKELQLLHAAVLEAPNAWIITNINGVIEWVNPMFTTITGYSFEEAVGRKTSILKSGEHSAQFYADMWATILRGEVWRGEIRNCRKDGSLYTEEMTIAPVRETEGKITHFVAIQHDITAEKQLRQQLLRTQRLESIGLLASGIAHDLNNIFAPISLSLELLKVKYPEAEARKLVGLIEQTTQRGADIIRQVLTFARGIEGERNLVQPKHLLKDISRLVEETFPRNIEVLLDIAPDTYQLLGDITQLHQVLLNLAVNARDAMPNGGMLRLRAGNVQLGEAEARRTGVLRPGPYVVLTVADNGTGIPPEVQERIFEPFFTTKSLGKGTGLGLSTVYGIVRSHSGLIEVKTEVGVGTEFRVLLPAAPVQAETTVSRPPMPGRVVGEGRTVLMVDDEQVIRLVTSGVLEKMGFSVVTAVDGLDGFEKFQRDPGRFALVMTDLMMPHMNGYQLIQKIRQIAPTLPIIASSGVIGESGAVTKKTELAQLGVNTLLTKPYGEAQLVHALRAELKDSSVPGGQNV